MNESIAQIDNKYEQQMDKEDSDQEIKGEEIVEDLTDIKDDTNITYIDDWDRRFVLAKYTEEQRRIVHMGNEKMKEWLRLNSLDDWKEQLNDPKTGLYVGCRNSERGLNTFKASRII